MLSRIQAIWQQVLVHFTYLKTKVGKYIAMGKHGLSTEAGVTELDEADWRDYYRLLRVKPEAEPEVIVTAFQRMMRLYQGALSDKAQESPLYSEWIDSVVEAYQVLSNPARRAEYDRIFALKQIPQEEPKITNAQVLETMRLVEQDFNGSHRKRRWKIPTPSSATRRAMVLTSISVAFILVAGTSLVFAQPQNTIATPFKSIAIGVTETSLEAIGLIEDIRIVVASFERSTISTALQSMRAIEEVKVVPAVGVPTNDMARFPSPEHRLFPDYLDRRFSQFRYTVDGKGIVSVDSSGATTDSLIDKIRGMLRELADAENR